MVQGIGARVGVVVVISDICQALQVHHWKQIQDVREGSWCIGI